MAILGLSLILAAIVYLAIRRPPLLDTILSVWVFRTTREQPPQTKLPTPGTPPTGPRPPPVSFMPDGSQEASSSSQQGQSGNPGSARSTTQPFSLTLPGTSHSRSMPMPPDGELSPETTPKAIASQLNTEIPSFSLSTDAEADFEGDQSLSPVNPPPSAAAVARAAPNDDASIPLLIAPVPGLSAPGTMMPPPPPRPPRLSNLPNPSAGSQRNLPIPNRHEPARQPGTSTLAPPPTHSSRPPKPSRKVILSPGHSPLDWARVANGPASDLRNLPMGTPYLKVTKDMLRKQTGRKGKDAWTSLGGRVYNITPYLPFHPGGQPELLRAAGRDGTKLFAEIHPWVNYEGMLASSLVGVLVDDHEVDRESGMDAMD